MKPTIKVSISGIAFNMDSDAYGCLQNYLERIERIFAGKESGREIIDDIEVRIAELFSARIQSPKQIITLAIVQEVIATVGSADDIAGDEQETASNAHEPFRTSPNMEHKRLFRDIDHRTIGGVCSGLGNYFGIDRVFIRLAFLFTGLFGLIFSGSPGLVVCLIYGMLWIAIPAARTVKEKMWMRKEPIAPARASLRYEEDDAEKVAHAGDFGNVLGKVIIITCRVIAGLLLAVVALCALALLIILPVGLITGNMILGEYMASDITYYIQHYTIMPLWLVIVLLTLLVCLPLFAVIYFISKALFRFKTAIRFGLILLVVWLVALLSLAGIGIYAVSGDSYFHDRLLSEQTHYNYVKKRILEPFTRLYVNGSFEVVVYQSDTDYVRIETSERLHPHIYTGVVDGQLSIYYKHSFDREYGHGSGHARFFDITIFNRCRHLFDVSNVRSKIHVYTTNVAALEQLDLWQNVRFVCDDTLRGGSAGELAINTSGTTRIKTAVNANSLTVTITGTSRAALSGIAANAKFTITGAATTDAPNLAADTLAVHLAGAGKMNIHINRHLNVHASGASLIEYTGAPTAEINTSGAAQVRRRELGSRK